LEKANNRWIAKIMVDDNAIYLGSFNSFESAVTARKDAENLYGFHANHGRGSA